MRSADFSLSLLLCLVLPLNKLTMSLKMSLKNLQLIELAADEKSADSKTCPLHSSDNVTGRLQKKTGKCGNFSQVGDPL